MIQSRKRAVISRFEALFRRKNLRNKLTFHFISHLLVTLDILGFDTDFNT
jgi:hypothetical protein